jgi:DNA polymerase, archaea type
VERIKTPNYVYDLEVEDTHRFFANSVLVHNTDSIFISLGKGKSMKDAEEFLKDVNKDLPSLMELELEGFYPCGLFVMKKGEGKEGAKKKYALLDLEGEIKVTGFETVRGDWSILAKEVQKEVLRIILQDNDVKKAVKYVKDIVDDINDGKIPIKKMSITKRLTKNIDEYSSIGPHVHVAKKLIEKGENIGAGSNIAYIIQPGKGSIGEKAVAAQEAKSYDSEYYVDNQIIPVVERIFGAVGYNKQDLTEKHKQKNLGDF